MCDGHCESCQSPCGAVQMAKNIELFTAKNNPKKGENQMSNEALPGASCHTTEAEKIAILTAQIVNLQDKVNQLGASSPLSTGIKTVVYLTAALALLACVFAGIAIGQATYYSQTIKVAQVTATNAQNTANKAISIASISEDRANKNFVYLRDMRRDFRRNK